jgi:hypothetical protein
MTWGEASDRYWDEVGRFHKGSGAENTRRSLDWLDREIGRTNLLETIGPSNIAALVTKRRGEPRKKQ